MGKSKSEAQKWFEHKGACMVELRVIEARTRDLTVEEADCFVDECTRLRLAGIGAFQITPDGVKLVKFADKLQKIIADNICQKGQQTDEERGQCPPL